VNTVLFERRGPAAWITLNRPEKFNAMNSDMVGELRARLREVETDEDVKVVVLAGAGRAFSAGYDISEEVGDRIVGNRLVNNGTVELGIPFFDALRNLRGRVPQAELEVDWRGNPHELRNFVVSDGPPEIVRRFDVEVDGGVDRLADRRNLWQ